VSTDYAIPPRAHKLAAEARAEHAASETAVTADIVRGSLVRVRHRIECAV